MMDQAQREELRDAFAHFMSVPFPQDSDDDQLSELYAELVALDSNVAALVQSVLGGVKLSLRELRYNEALEIQLSQIRLQEGDANTSEADTYLRYLQQLKQLLDLATKVNASA